jgi:hypothetical protein
MNRAVNCDECRHYDASLLDAGEGWPCSEGHKPRFYQPQTVMQAERGDYGWRRRCGDFERDVKAEGQA